MIRLFEEKQNMYAWRTWVGQVDFPPDTDTEGRGLNRGPLSGPQKGALCVGAGRRPLLRHNVVIIKLGLLMATIQNLKTLWCIMLENELMIWLMILFYIKTNRIIGEEICFLLVYVGTLKPRFLPRGSASTIWK